jgi:transketolase
VTLRYVPLEECRRVVELDADRFERAAAFADVCRLNALYMIERAGSGHPGTTFSSIDVVSWLHLEVLRDGDRYFSSKGHDVPGLYAVLTALGRLDFGLIHELRKLDGLPGHPDVAATPEVVTSTGSLGMGVSKARGFVLADRLQGREGRVYVLTGDGELQEGQFWESLQPTANRKLAGITVIVDRNLVQSDTWVSEVSDLGDLPAKLREFGWAVGECDGHDLQALAETLGRLEAAEGPRAVVAHTRKGAGVSFMEPEGNLPRTDTALYGYHSGAPTEDEYERALEEIRTRLDERLDRLGAAPVELVEAAPPEHRSAPQDRQRLVPTYGEALVEAAAAEPRLVALDADLRLDTGLVAFRERYPDRFFECGIAEQDMVSQAGAMALAGLVPVCHSFACFLSTRPNEQIYNNATERTKVVYVGSLAGIVPGGPGHSHQSVRDISALGAMPGMALLEPFCESEVRAAVDWIVHRAPGPVYLRLVSVPWSLGFEPPEIELEPGRGTLLRPGADVVFVGAGPVMIGGAWRAADLLAAEGVEAGVVALPWLRDVDGAWLAETAGDAAIVTLDNHYVSGGQGDAVLAALAAEAPEAAGRVRKIGVTSIPKSGGNNEVLAAHGLDGDGIAAQVLASLRISSAS